MLTRLACVVLVHYRKELNRLRAGVGKRPLSLDQAASWLYQNCLQGDTAASVLKDLKTMEDHGSRFVGFEEAFGAGFCLVLKTGIAKDLFVFF